MKDIIPNGFNNSQIICYRMINATDGKAAELYAVLNHDNI